MREPRSPRVPQTDAGNILLADMRYAIIEEFEEFITSLDMRIPKMGKARVDFDEAKTEFQTQLARLDNGLKKIDECSTDRIPKLITRMKEVLESDITAAGKRLLDAFAEIVNGQ
jgi:hypothetical protein